MKMPFSRTLVNILYWDIHDTDTLNANNFHQMLFFPFFLTYIMCHRSSPLSTRPHPHFPLDLVWRGKYTLLNLAFVGLGKSLKNKLKLEIMFAKQCAQNL